MELFENINVGNDGTIKTITVLQEGIFGLNPGWEQVNYPQSTTVYGIAKINNIEVVKGCIITAFVGDECRGVKEISYEGRFSMLIQGNSSETANFKLFDLNSFTILEADYKLATSPGNIMGHPSPVVIDFLIASEDGNHVPTIKSNILNVDISPGFESRSINLNEYFHDKDNDVLTYEVHVSNGNVLSVKVDNNWLSLIEKGLGTSEITVIANDGRGRTAIQIFYINVSQNPNKPPQVENKFYQNEEDSELRITLNATDDVEPIGSLTFELVRYPKNATIFDINGYHIKYVPQIDFDGWDSFTYRAQDKNGSWSEVATISIEMIPVNDPPTAVDNELKSLGKNEFAFNLEPMISDVDNHFDELKIDFVLKNDSTYRSIRGADITKLNDSNNQTYLYSINTVTFESDFIVYIFD